MNEIRKHKEVAEEGLSYQEQFEKNQAIVKFFLVKSGNIDELDSGLLTNGDFVLNVVSNLSNKGR